MRLKVHRQFVIATLVWMLGSAAVAHAQMGGTSNEPSPGAGADLRWPTKAALLAAASAGEFAGIPRSGDADAQTDLLAASVLYVLQKEYGVPPLPNDRQCARGAASEVKYLLSSVLTYSNAGLSNRPPEFSTNINVEPIAENLRSQIKRAGTGGGWCEVEVNGSRRPHPYGAALLSLADEFAKSSDRWVDAERLARQKAYATRVATQKAEDDQKLAERQRADAERRATEQQRIDTERSRIEADQKRRQQQDKNRIAG